MAQGFCPPLLRHIRTVTECNTPQAKITPVGFLRMLWENRPQLDIINPDNALRLDDGQGHIRDLVLKYLKRAVPGQIATADNCDIDIVQDYLEMTVATTNYRKVGLYVSDEDMARYCEEATRTVNLGGGPTRFMQEQLDRIIAAANGILGAMDTDLLTLQAANFGVNVVTGSNAATTVNFSQDSTLNDYTTGMTKILQDASLNEFCGRLLIAGHGNFNAFDMQQLVACCAANGIDSSRWTGYQFYPDIYSQTIWGTNHIGVFSAGSVGLIELNRYDGWRSGLKGASEFFTMPLPVDCPECNGDMMTMNFDVQAKYYDCPTLINVGCEGETTIPRGWVITIGKSFGLFNIPADSYQDTDNEEDCYDDRLSGNNGTLRYVVTNTAP